MSSSSTDRYDVAVIGSGPGGYVAAIRAAQLGMRVAVVEEDKPGGVCLNWGCIPSKALLTGAELVESLRRHGDMFGVDAQGITLDYGKVIDHSRKCADRLAKGVASLLRKNQIDFVPGRGRLAAPNTVVVSGAEPREVVAQHVVVASGSTEFVPPGVEIDGHRVLTSRQALESRIVPNRLVVIGAGAVGLEFAYIYAMYGARVTVIEMADQMLPGADRELAGTVQREFRRKGIEVRLGTRFESIKRTNGDVRVQVQHEDRSEELEADQVLVAIGRRPLSADLGLEELGVETDRRGFVQVDERGRTSIVGVLAIGDVTGGALLAHKASEEGVAAMEFLAGEKRHPLDPLKIPACIYAQPQVAWIGLTEERARETYGDDLRVGKFPFTASGKAVASGHTAGFAKILAEPHYGEIVGAHVVGYGATELIAEIGLGMTLEATTAELAHTTHAHPTLSEAILEAALAAEGHSINF